MPRGAQIRQGPVKHPAHPGDQRPVGLGRRIKGQHTLAGGGVDDLGKGHIRERGLSGWITAVK